MVKTEKWQQLRHKMKLLDINENDLQESFIIGSGRGGQKLHKTASCVFLVHVPTGISTKCQQERSRESNRYYARKRLCKKIEVLKLEKESEQQKTIEKIRRQKRKRSKRAKQKILEQKNIRSKIKEDRKKPSVNDH